MAMTTTTTSNIIFINAKRRIYYTLGRHERFVRLDMFFSYFYCPQYMFIHSPNRRLSFRIGNGFEKYTNRCPCVLAHTHSAQAHCTLSPSYYCFWCRLVVMVSCVGRGRVRCLRKRDSDRKYMYFFSVFEQPTLWTVTTANTQCEETETARRRECECCVFSLITYDNLGLGAMHNSKRDRERERELCVAVDMDILNNI